MTKDMTTGPITPLLVNFTIPLVLGNLFQLTYNAVDSIIVGKFVGEDALAAVGTSNPLMTLAILFISGVCLGAGILVSLAFGAGNTELVERQVSTTAIAGSVFSLVFSLTCVILANPLLRLLQVPEEILPIAVNYPVSYTHLTQCHLSRGERPWQSPQSFWFCQGLPLWGSWTHSGLRGRAA